MPPRTRISDAPQRVSARDTLPQRRASTESNSIHPKPLVNKSPRLFGDRRSPKGSQSDPLSRRKLGTRISGLENQLVQAQLELKTLKQHLASAESVKKSKIKPLPTKKSNGIQETSEEEADHEETHKETDVFEVPMEKNVSVEPTPELEVEHRDDDKSEIPLADELEKPSNEIEQLKEKLEAVCEENEIMKKQLNEVNLEVSAAVSREEEMAVKCNQLQKDVEASNAAKLEARERLEAVESAKEELEEEMKKLRVQTEQWRKAADAAAAVLAESGGGRFSKSYGSMEKHFNGVFETPLVGGYTMCSPELEEDSDDGFGSGKRKGSGGIRMFGDLWKKKGQK